MAAALAVSSVGFRFATWRGHPALAAQCVWPTRTDIDRPLVIGAALFGIGWGLVGLCPGPALENLRDTLPPGDGLCRGHGLGHGSASHLGKAAY